MQNNSRLQGVKETWFCFSSTAGQIAFISGNIDNMEIPLRLVGRKDGSLFYGVPLYFRLIMAGMLILMISAIGVEGFNTSVIGWIIIILLLLGFVYKEDWTFDPSSRHILSQIGFYPLLKKTGIAFEEVAYLQLAPISKGTIPGSKEEEAANREAFNEMRGKEAGEDSKAGIHSLFQRKKLYIALLIITKNEEHYLIDMIPARRASRLSQTGKALAALVGCPFLDDLYSKSNL